MAQRLKADGVERKTGNCPICHQPIPNGLFHETANYVHITANCPGPRRKGKVERFRRAA